MNISISNKAYSNMQNITKFTSRISAKYANRVVSEIYSTIDSIKYDPYIGRYVPELSDKHFRERIYKDYRIIYYVSETNQTIYVQNVFSGKQNSNLFFEVHKSELYKFLNQIIN